MIIKPTWHNDTEILKVIKSFLPRYEKEKRSEKGVQLGRERHRLKDKKEKNDI